MSTVTFTNEFGQQISWFLLTLRATGFFEAYVFIPLMTLVSIPLFVWLRQQLNTTRQASTMPAALAGVAYYILCFFLTNVTAVAFKTLIREELDYTREFWFIPYVGPLHFYIASAIIAYLILISRRQRSKLDPFLCLYIQLALLGGYAIAIHRLLNEPFDLLDPTTGVSGLFMMLAFSVYNWDIGVRLFRCLPALPSCQTYRPNPTAQ